MAKHQATYKWEIDWNGNGNYDHAYSDITKWWMQHKYTVGARTGYNAIKPGTMQGSVTIFNEDGIFDPDDPRLQVDESRLRTKNLIRHSANGILLWEGLCILADRRPSRNTPTIVFELQSRHHDALTIPNGELNTSSGTVSSLARRFSDISKVPFAASSSQPHGIVYHNGNWMRFLTDFGLYAGGWAIEDIRGNWTFHRFIETPNLPIAAVFGFAYGYDDKSLEYQEYEGHVRNTAECRAFTWERIADPVILGSTKVQMRPLQQRWVDVEFRTSLTRRIIEWTDTEVSGGDGSIIAITSPIRELSPTKIQVQITTAAFGLPLTREFTVAAKGIADKKVEVEPKKLEIDLFNTLGVFTPKELNPPEWFTPSFDGIADYTLPWLRNLSQPTEHLKITYPEWQETQGQFTTLATQGVPGKAVQADVIKNDRQRRANILITSIEHRDQINGQPLRTIRGVTRRSFAPAPLTARINRLVFNAVEIAARVPSHAGQKIYSRLRTADE